jgi:hypothetical protein
MVLSNRGFLLVSVILALLAGLAFVPGLPGSFILDDIRNIVENTGLHLRSLQPAAVLEATYSPQPGSTTRFVPMLTFALDHFRGGGLDPGTFKATNFAIHALTTAALAWFFRELLLVAGVARSRSHWAALALALAWAVHPLQVSSVLYIVQRMQTLATLFIVLALWAYLRARVAQIEDRSGRAGWALTGLLWALAVGCKEDAALLPAYLLALELTLLRFRAADPGVARVLQRGYLTATLLGLATFVFLVVPHSWSWDAHAGRDFSSIERLLSQGRVLCLYLWQMLVPVPAQMPFFYDWLAPSRGLLTPWTTLPALMLLAALLASAWRLRHRRPLFAFGVLVFFAGHFVTSNVIPLELAFEHRNHLPLIGIVLAVGDLLALAAGRLRLPALPAAMACAASLLALAGATLVRADAWSSGVSLAQASTRLAPTSVRAWNFLCVEWYEAGGGTKAGNPYLDRAIPACEQAAELAPHSVASFTNVLAFKTQQGTASRADWDRYLERLRRVPMTGENVYSMWAMTNMVRKGIALDETGVLAVIDTICERVRFEPADYAALGVFILGHTSQPDRAYPHFARAVLTTPDPSFANGLIDYLRREGHPEWADRLQASRRATH